MNETLSDEEIIEIKADVEHPDCHEVYHYRTMQKALNKIEYEKNISEAWKKTAKDFKTSCTKALNLEEDVSLEAIIDTIEALKAENENLKWAESALRYKDAQIKQLVEALEKISIKQRTGLAGAAERQLKKAYHIFENPDNNYKKLAAERDIQQAYGVLGIDDCMQIAKQALSTIPDVEGDRIKNVLLSYIIEDSKELKLTVRARAALSILEAHREEVKNDA